MITRTALIFATMCAVSLAAVRSGNAAADWLAASTTYTAGKPVQTALRLVVDEGWHTYWENPGESGVKISVEWELPAGWTAGEVEQPVPKRFMTGELAGFGYDGTVIFPVKFTPPADFTGLATLRGKVSWLTCNDDKCVPGEAELELKLEAGAPVATAEAGLIDDALKKIPRPQSGNLLAVAEKEDSLVITLGKSLRPDDYEIFPATPQIIDSATAFTFASEEGKWVAEVPKSEYAPKPIRQLTLVLVGKSGQIPISLTWKSE
jgi:DsbC/DsbD-like thiol-disulfide interchange protein